MTTSQAKTDAVAPPLPAERCHLRLATSAQVVHTEAGRFAVPLDLREGTAERTPLQLILTADEAVDLHAQLGTLLVVKDGDAA